MQNEYTFERDKQKQSSNGQDDDDDDEHWMTNIVDRYKKRPSLKVCVVRHFVQIIMF